MGSALKAAKVVSLFSTGAAAFERIRDRVFALRGGRGEEGTFGDRGEAGKVGDVGGVAKLTSFPME